MLVAAEVGAVHQTKCEHQYPATRYAVGSGRAQGRATLTVQTDRRQVQLTGVCGVDAGRSGTDEEWP